MPQKITPTPEARALAKQVVKDSNGARVKFGRTNGQIVLHVFEPGGRGFTIAHAGEWAECPINPERTRRDGRTSGNSAEREQEITATEALIANRDAI